MLKKVAVLLIIMTTLIGIIFLSACSSVEVDSISIDPSSKYTTEYFIGDDIDLNGIKIIVKRTDGVEEYISLTDIRQDIIVMNFNSSKPKEALSVVVEYKGQQTFFIVSISEATSASLRHKVSFDTGEGGQQIDDQEVLNYGSAAQPKDPIRTGYIFDGWYSEKSYNNLWNFNVDKVTKDTVLYAKWAVSYTITFIPTEGDDLTPIVRYVKAGDTLSNIPSVPEVKGKVGEWVRTDFVNVASNHVTESIYFVKTFTVIFCYIDTDGVTLQTLKAFENVPYGTNMAEDGKYSADVAGIHPPTIINHTRYAGTWNTSYLNVTTDLTIQAVYESNRYTFTFSNNYIGAEEPYALYENRVYGNTIEPPQNPTREGYSFDGWFRDSNCTVPWEFDLMIVDKDTTLYAKWVKQYQVYFLIAEEDFEYFEDYIEIKTFQEEGVDVDYKVYLKESVRENTNIVKPNPPFRGGYSSSWNMDDAAFNPVRSDLKVVARFTIRHYTVEFCTEDGGVISSQEVEYKGQAVPPTNLNPLMKEGYSFKNWREDFSSIEGDLKVYPIYEAKNVSVNIYPRNQYNDPETGRDYYTIVCKYDDLIVLTDSSPSYTGHQFEGWYSDINLQAKWNLASDLIKTEAEVNLYAKWLQKYEVKFVDESGIQVPGGLFEVVDGQKFTSSYPTVPEKEGHIANWHIVESGEIGHLADDAYWNRTIITNHVLVKPKYDIKKYDVVYVLDSFEILLQKVEHGASRTLPNQGDIDAYLAGVGKIFDRWEPDIPLAQPIVENITINAVTFPMTFSVIWRDSNYNLLHEEPEVVYGENAEYIFNNLGIAKPEKEGYSFTGWKVHTPENASMSEVKCDLIIDPVFQIKNYVVNVSNLYSGLDRLENKNLTSSYSDYFAFGQDGKVAIPQRTGYTFTGWDYSKFFIEYRIHNGVEYWVITNPDTPYTDTLYFDAGMLIIYRGEIYRETPPTNPRLGEEDWTTSCGKLVKNEQGWLDVVTNTHYNYKSIALPGKLINVYGEDCDYSANYKINSFTVTFDTVVNPSYLENIPNDFVGNYGTKPSIPSPPTWAGYVFLGWYTDESYVDRWDKPGGGAYQMLENDYTVYAKWEAATYNPTEGISYTLNDQQDGYIVTGMQNVDSSNLTHVTISNYYNNLPVVGIGFRAIYSNLELASKLKSIELPNTLYYLSNNAFENCISLESIEIPSFVTALPSNVFSGCVKLNSIVFQPNSVIENIDEFAFAYNVSLKTITLPNGLTSIGNYAFYQCLSLVSIDILGSVTSIGKGAFSHCTSLTHAKFHSQFPINLGENAFFSPPKSYHSFKAYVVDPLKYAVGSSWANLNWQTLYEEGKIIDIEHISNDGQWAFDFDRTGVKLLQYLGDSVEVSVPSNILTIFSANEYVVMSLADYLFDSKVTSIKFESSMEFEQDAFSLCDRLDNITLTIVNNSIPITNFDLSYVYNNSGSALTKFSVSSTKKIVDIFGGSVPTSIKEIVIIDKDEFIVANMFEGCTNVEIIRFNTRIQQVRDNAFSGCVALQEVHIKTNILSDNSLELIGKEAFYGCYSLKHFYISSSENAEEMIEGLPSTITSIGQDAFKGTAWLAQREPGLIIIGDGIVYTYKNSTSLSPVVILPAGVKNILENAFYGNSYVTHLIPEENSQLKWIGANAFRYCSALEAVVVPEGFISFGNYAFESATKLGTLVMLGLTAPLFGGSFITNTLKHSSAGQSDIEIYVSDSLAPEERAKYQALITTYSYSVNFVDNLFLSYGGDENEKWVLSDADASSGAGFKAIKFFGNSTICHIPSVISGGAILEIANNAFTRGIEELALNLAMRTQTWTFSGLTRITRLQITAPNIDAVKMDGGGLYQLMLANRGLSTLSTSSTYSIKDVLNGEILPQNVSKVEIISGQTQIESSFLEDCVYVNAISIMSEVGNDLIDTPLETPLDSDDIYEKNILITRVKERAFSGTGWMQAREHDFIAVLDGILVDYKGINNVLEIPNNIKTIGYGVFNGNKDIEIIYLPEEVKTIEEYAFAEMENLIKVFLLHEDEIPSVKQNSFTVGQGREIFVKPDKILAYNEAENWPSFSPKKQPDTSLIVKEISRDFIKDSTGNLLLEVRTISYLLDTQGVIDGSNAMLHWIRDTYIAYDIPNDTRSYEKYKEGLLENPIVSIRESSEVVIPNEIYDEGKTYIIKKLGNNVFMSKVSTISINLDDEVTNFSFENLKMLNEIVVLGSEHVAERKVSGKDLTKIISSNNLTRLSYSGEITLDTLLDIVLDGPIQDQNLRPDSLRIIRLFDGITETVDEMLKGWDDIDEIIFPSSILKAGINSIDNTLWFRNYYNPKYGSDFVVLADKLLYKYRGTSSNILVPASVEIINTGAFSRATWQNSDWEWSSNLSFTTLRFGQDSKLHTIREHAFHGCLGLNNFNAPDRLRVIAENAFDGTQFSIDATSGLLMLEGSYVQGKTIVKYFGDRNVSYIVLPADVAIIAAGAFAGLEELQEISWGGSASILSHIGERAFYGCSSLNVVPLGNGPYTPKIASVGRDAFAGTLFAEGIFLRDDGKEVVYKHTGSGDFTVTSNMFSVTPGAITSSIVRVILNADAQISQSDMYALLSTPSVTRFTSDASIPLRTLIGSTDILLNIQELFFLESTQNIVAEYANGWTSIYSINWPSNLKTVGRDAFTGTQWLNDVQNDYVTPGGSNVSGVLIKYKGVSPNVYIDHRITSISADAFRDNIDIVQITFDPNSKITEISPSSFSGCINLESIVGLPNTIISIGQDAFKNTLWLQNQDDLVIINGLLIAYRGSSEDIYIPKEVKKIYPYAFSGNNVISSVEFDKYSTIEAIEANTFANCIMLASVILSESINYIDSQAFINTQWLSLVQASQNGGFIVYEDSYTKEYRLIKYVGTKTNVSVPSQTTEIGAWTFRDNKNIERVNIDKGLYLPDYLFSGCTALTEINLSNLVTFGENAFAMTPWLINKTADFVSAGNGYLVKYNGAGGDVLLPSWVKGIAGDVFRDNLSLESINLSQTQISTLPNSCFAGAINLSSIEFSITIKNFGEDAFKGTEWLENQGDFVVINGVLVAYKGSATNITIPSTVSYLPRYVFEGNANITKITFDANPIVLEDYAFYGCSSLSEIVNAGLIEKLGAHTFRETPYYQSLSITNQGYPSINGILLGYTGLSGKVTIPSKIEHIAPYAFNASNLTELSFATRTTDITIGERAFANNPDLATVTLISKIKMIENRAFYNTYWLDNLIAPYVVVDNKLLMYAGRSSTIEIASNITGLAYGIFTNNKSITSVNFRITSQSEFFIPPNSFSGCSNLSSITLPINAYIGGNAFAGTPWLAGRGEFAHYNNKLFAYNGQSTSIIFPSNLVGIYPYVFSGKSDLESVVFTSTKVESLANGEFAGCTSLQNVSLNSSLRELSPSAFAGTPWLRDYSQNNNGAKFIILGGVKLMANISSDTEIEIPEGINFIGAGVFEGNTQITKVSFENVTSMISIPNYAFRGCTSLEEVVLVGYVEEVGIDAFLNTPWYENLQDGGQIFVNRLLFFKGEVTEYEVPANVTHIGTNAFLGAGIVTLTMTSEVPCSLGRGDVLQGIETIYVPSVEAQNSYKNNSSWIQYSEKIKVLPQD